MLKKLTLLMVLTALIGCGTAEAKKKAKMPEGKLTEVEYSEWGMMRTPNKYYKVSKDNDGKYWIENISHYGDTTKYQITESDINDLREVIERDNLYKLESSYLPKEKILDGESWHFFANFEGENFISSGGSNAWPKDIALNGIAEKLKDIYFSAEVIAEERARLEKKPEGKLTRIVYAKYGSTAGPQLYYELNYEPVGKVAKKKKAAMGYVLRTINPKRWEHPSEPEYLMKKLTAAQALKITDFVTKNKMYAFDGSYPGPKGLLDGSTWKFELEYSSGDNRSSGGSTMNGPLDSLDGLLTIFQTLLPNR